MGKDHLDDKGRDQEYRNDKEKGQAREEDSQYAPQGLIEAVSNQGFEAVVVSGETGVKLAVEAMREIYNSNIDVIALATRNAEFLPVILKAKEKGKETVVIGVEPGFSAALKHAADYTIVLEPKKEGRNK